MYFHFYGEKDRARKLFADLSLETNKDLFQSDFSVAERRCPQGLPIGKLMRQAVALLS
jgi:hypothetical protein